MAIQKGTIIVRGKIGNIVGMKNGFGTKKEGFARSYVAEIANPQTSTQMNQRAKMLPAVLFRRQLAEVIARAWEGKKYGGQSIREFMKYALKEPWTNVPQLVKDSAVAIPGAYLIAKGSLPTIGVSIVDGMISTSLKISTFSTPGDSVGTLSSELIENNSFLREGDQLTFIRVAAPSANIPYAIYNVASFYLDTTSTTMVEEVMGKAVNLIGDNEVLSIDNIVDGQEITLGGAVVLSREGNNSNQRSTQRFVLNSSALTAYFANALKASVAETYKNAASSRGTTDWPYENSQAEETTGGNASVERVAINVSVTPTGAGTVTGGGSKAIGSTCNLQASAASNYTFSGWKVNGSTVSTANPYSFEVTEALNIVAEFRSADDPGEDRP